MRTQRDVEVEALSAAIDALVRMRARIAAGLKVDQLTETMGHLCGAFNVCFDLRRREAGL